MVRIQILNLICIFPINAVTQIITNTKISNLTNPIGHFLIKSACELMSLNNSVKGNRII